MKASVEFELQPFNVPNYVLVKEEPGQKQDGFKEGRKFHLRELDSVTLDELCWEFRDAVFKKAGKQ